MDSLLEFLKAAADASRLRILRLLLRDELNVGELTAILGIAQSSVSQKLRALRKAGLVEERRRGGFTFYGLIERPGEATFELLRSELTDADDPSGDLSRLAEVLRARSDRGDGSGKLVEPGRSWVAWARALRFVLPKLRVADFGCGDGALTVEIAAWAESVVAIERDAELCRQARDRIARAGIGNITLVESSIESALLETVSVDLVVISHALHHAPAPDAILRRGFEMLATGGRVLILELASHHELWVREKLGHARLGFTVAELDKALAEAGYGSIEVELTPQRAAPSPFRILIASAVKS